MRRLITALGVSNIPTLAAAGLLVHATYSLAGQAWAEVTGGALLALVGYVAHLNDGPDT